MPIPSISEVKETLLEELEKAGGVGESKDIIEKLSQRFGITPAERGLKNRYGYKIFDHDRVHAAVTQLRKQDLIEPKEKSGRGIWKLSNKYWTGKREAEPAKKRGDEIRVKSAEEATEIALDFVKKYYPFYHRPIKSVKEDSIWLVEIDVGLVTTIVAKVKIDAKTGNILEFVKSD